MTPEINSFDIIFAANASVATPYIFPVTQVIQGVSNINRQGKIIRTLRLQCSGRLDSLVQTGTQTTVRMFVVMGLDDTDAPPTVAQLISGSILSYRNLSFTRVWRMIYDKKWILSGNNPMVYYDPVAPGPVGVAAQKSRYFNLNIPLNHQVYYSTVSQNALKGRMWLVFTTDSGVPTLVSGECRLRFNA